jgi:ribosome-binding protein aMBF1 (putative translation factor)
MPAFVTLPDARDVTVKQLTVAEAEAWARGASEDMKTDPAKVKALAKGLSRGDLADMTDASKNDLKKYTKEELKPLVDAAREANPYLFSLRAQAARRAKRIIAEAEAFALGE